MTLAEIEAVRCNAELLFDHGAVGEAYDRMAAQITETLGNANPVLLCVMSGGLVPASEIFTRLNFPVELDYVHATRYRGTQGDSELDWIAHPAHSLQGRSVLVVDDILDEGVTLAAILDFCGDQGAEDVHSAVLVEKQHERKAPGLKADFIGLTVEDRYVFGCGMDYHGYWRNLPDIYGI
ncbi:Hypoxanthine-guanine phosphoribosyltransferase [hydrothermal vent metagenome]|uniref:Hypoxanthine-guanine phosphoribosyltransferase n=1 Tax=hydrothermal vent metagenome TaxID=652676 RepID=A0A3B0YDD3_9ZZZZ